MFLEDKLSERQTYRFLCPVCKKLGAFNEANESDVAHCVIVVWNLTSAVYQMQWGNQAIQDLSFT